MTMIIVNSQNKKPGLKQSSLIACTDLLQGTVSPLVSKNGKGAAVLTKVL